MRSGARPICYGAGVASKVVSFVLTCLVFWCFLVLSSVIYNFISSNAVYADCSAAMTVDGEITLNVMANNGNTVTDTVTVDTDCSNGYTLSISAPADSNLYLNGDSSNNTNYIAPTQGTSSSPTMIVGEGKYNTWGISMDGNTTVSSNTFFNIPNEKMEIYSKNTSSEVGGDRIDVYYGASASYGLAAGAYTMANNGKIVYYLIPHPGVMVYFDANGGTTPSFESKEVTPGQPYGELPTTSKNDYTLLGWSRYNLPIEYQAVEYIQFNGGQYIDTGVIPSNHMTEVKADFDFTNKVLFSTTNSFNYYEIALWNNKYFWGTNGRQYSAGNWVQGSGAHTIIYNNYDNEVIVDSELLGTGYTITSTSNLLIGRRNTSSTDYPLVGKIYYFTVTDKTTGDVVRNMIPVYRKDDETIGMYDTINNKFYTNNGTGAFTKGRDVDTELITSSSTVTTNDDHTLFAIWGHNPTVTFEANGGTIPSGTEWQGSGDTATKTITYDSIYGEIPTPTRNNYSFLGWYRKTIPIEYQEVEYLQFNGAQYIDTGIIPSNHMTEIQFDFGEYRTETILGTSRGIKYYYFVSYGDKYYIGFNGSEGGYGNWTSGKHTLIFNGENNAVVLDGETLVTGKDIASTANLLIGLREAYYLEGKIYSVQITNKSTGAIVRDMTPVYRKSDGVIGMYDAITQSLFTNAGTGLFSTGPDIDNTPITSSRQVITNKNHTLYAMWEET